MPDDSEKADVSLESARNEEWYEELEMLSGWLIFWLAQPPGKSKLTIRMIARFFLTILFTSLLDQQPVIGLWAASERSV